MVIGQMDLARPVRMAIWAPVALGAGSIVYYGLQAEPPPALTGVLATAGLLAVLAGWTTAAARPLLWSILMLAAFAAFGFARAQHHTLSQDMIFVEDSGRARAVEGWIEAVQNSNGRERVILRVASLDGMDRPPERIRFYARRGEFGPGEGVSARVVLTPPRRPAVPGGYDPAFAAWFSGLGGTGYAIAPLAAAEVNGDRWRRLLARWRWQMAEHIRERAAPETSGIAAALITGDRSGIPPDQAEALRVAGLGHILAISGLHMSLFAGGLFFVTRAMGAAIPAFARKYDPRIPAALIALTGALLYLILSGASVSTQRAFVMVSVVLLGVLLKRRAISLQSIALAATIILILQPQSILAPGFQMSFAAASALVAAFDLWRRRETHVRQKGTIDRFIGFWGTLSFSSLVAGSATAAYAAFHFNRIAVYGLAANLAAMPVFSLVVMPAGALALALAPFGLDGPALAVMSRGLIWVVWIAEGVASWPGSLAPAASAPGAVLALYAFGFVLLVAASSLVRRIGAVAMIAAYAAWFVHQPPDAFISEEGVVLARFEDGEGAGWASTDRRRARFATSVFLEQAGEPVRPGRDGIECDPRGCAGRAQGLAITVSESGETLGEDCAVSDIVVLKAFASPVERAVCEARLVDLGELQDGGSIALWLQDGRIVRESPVEARRGRRIWAVSDSGG
ncbi:ComEC/Rec2 family competence protein [Hyphobacterium indicum]|uniref:ComEC/Rec2 family competence protein n=1 Tax=Hyphobacterium indicum TaxID=2162714 RepID=UPI000D651C2C|nr:ComEC/Rec2 family competence protein [Hyphobacterium indicum]